MHEAVKGFGRMCVSPRFWRVSAVAATTGAFILAVGILYGLGSIFRTWSGDAPVVFPAGAAEDWLGPARIDFGADYVAHVIPLAFVGFGMAILIPWFASRPMATLLGSLAVSAAWHVIGFSWYLPPHGVISDAVDDMLLVASVFVAALHCVIAFIARGATRIRSIVAAAAIGALLIETAVLHATIILPAAEVYDKQGEWLATHVASVARQEADLTDLCRRNRLVCLVRERGTLEVLTGSRVPEMPDVVVARAMEAVEKYGVFERPKPSGPRIWTLRHRSFNNYTGALRMPAVEVEREGRRIVIVDVSTAPIANLWVRSYTHLHMLPLCVVWSVMIALTVSVHGPRSRVSGRAGADSA